jgi:beta-barrel assembly-enhancing protease
MAGLPTRFPARLFGPGIGRDGMAVQGWWEGGSLVTAVAGGAERIVHAKPQVNPSGWTAEQMWLNMPAGAGEYSLFLETAGARQAMLDGAPPAIRAQAGAVLQRERRSGFFMRAMVWSGALLLLAPVLLLLALVLRFGAIAEWVAAQVPPSYEAKIGDAALAQARLRYTLKQSGPAFEAVQTIGSRLTAGSRYQYRWFIAQDEQVNAFAAPGGVVVVNTGLIKLADTPEQLAAVLAHEVVHVEQRHSLSKLIESAGIWAAMAFLTGDMGGTVLGSWTAELMKLKFSRALELEADRQGLQRLLRARIDPAQMPVFFDKMAAQAKGREIPAILSTHPASKERSEALRALLASQPARQYQPLPLDWTKVRATLAGKR